MKKSDKALEFSNPRILSAAYFGLLSVVGTMLIDAILTIIGFENVIPLFAAVLLGMLVASCTGALFGKSIIYCEKPYKSKVFFLGFSMVLLSLPLFVLAVVLLLKHENSPILSMFSPHDLLATYFIILGYSYLLFGFVLATAAGLSAMYLRSSVVYDILHTDRKGALHNVIVKPKMHKKA